MRVLRKIAKATALLFLLTFAAGNPVFANDINEFARLSNIKDGLERGDCERYGGSRSGMPKNPMQTLEAKGIRLGGYNNVRRYQGDIYVVYSVAKKSLLGSIVGNSERQVTICKFKQ